MRKLHLMMIAKASQQRFKFLLSYLLADTLYLFQMAFIRQRQMAMAGMLFIIIMIKQPNNIILESSRM